MSSTGVMSVSRKGCETGNWRWYQLYLLPLEGLEKIVRDFRIRKKFILLDTFYLLSIFQFVIYIFWYLIYFWQDIFSFLLLLLTLHLSSFFLRFFLNRSLYFIWFTIFLFVFSVFSLLSIWEISVSLFKTSHFHKYIFKYIAII